MNRVSLPTKFVITVSLSLLFLYLLRYLHLLHLVLHATDFSQRKRNHVTFDSSRFSSPDHHLRFESLVDRKFVEERAFDLGKEDYTNFHKIIKKHKLNFFNISIPKARVISAIIT